MEHVYGKSDTRIAARAGETFVVELEGTPTAGFRWTLSPDPADALRVVSHDVQPGGPGIGASAKERFRIEALSQGAAKLRAEYKRPWESAVRQSIEFEVEIRK